MLWLGLVWLLGGCGTSNNTPQYAALLPTPTALPTVADYNNVPDMATVGVRRPTATALPAPAIDTADSSLPNLILPPTSTPDLLATIAMSGSNQDIALPTFGRPPDQDYGPTANVTQLNNLLGTPGPLAPTTRPPFYYPTSTAGSRLNGQPSRPYPTPTLDSSPSQAKVADLRDTKVSFQNAYHFVQVDMAKLQPDARLIFASANILSSSRTVWTFLFVWLDGNRSWKIIYDSSQIVFNPTEVAPPGRLIDAQLIDMSRVLDSPALIDKAVISGLPLQLPIDIINFQVDGTTHQPSFIMTNTEQGKQVVVNAYTGAIIRNEFAR